VHDDTTPAIGDNFDRLLNEMPRIAQAVNQFESEKNQRHALEALVQALGITTPRPTVTMREPALSRVPDEVSASSEADDPSVRDDDGPVPLSAASVRKTASKRTGAKKSYPRAKDINFRPEGKQSLREFVEQKAASTNNDRNLLIVYYFENILEQEHIGVAEVLAGYDEIGCKPPSQPDNSLMVTASQKKSLDTSDMKKIRTTHKGRNTVEFDMPVANKEKKTA